MQNINYGCQTYPWQMDVEKFRGNMSHILNTISSTVFTGVEAEIVMLGSYYNDWAKFAELLSKYQIQFAALVLHEPWLLEKETDQERANANEAIEFLCHFPSAKLLLGHVAVDPVREHNLRKKQDNHMKCIKEIGRRAAEKGVVSVFHPNSAPNSIFRYWEDYEIMFETLNKCEVGFAPDAGHMMNGGIDPLKMITYSREKVRHVHFKDMDNNHNWVTMGQGIGDFNGIINFLNATDYSGWIVIEDESPDAINDPDAVVKKGSNLIDTLK